GINNREDSYTVATEPCLKRLGTLRLKWLKQTLHFLGVSTAHQLQRDQQTIINRLNKDAKIQFGPDFIPPLPPGETSTVNINNIHHDAITVSKIFGSIVTHLFPKRLSRKQHLN